MPDKTYLQIKDLVPGVLKTLGKDIMGLRTGINILDKQIRGLSPNDYVIIAARTSQGKTSLAVDIVLSVSANVPVAFFSLEMDSKTIVERMITNLCKLDHHLLLSGEIGPDSQLWKFVIKAADDLSKRKIILDDSSTLSPDTLESKLYAIKSEYGLGCVIIDYLQLMSMERPESRQQEVSDISRRLKQLNKDFAVPFVALCQLNRAVEHEGGRPKLRHLRESGSLEQDADKVILIHNPDVEEKLTGYDGSGEAELIIAKNRNGPTGVLEVGWMFDYMSFMDRI